MATVVIMPRQGQSVESCIITAFNKKVGDSVAQKSRKNFKKPLAISRKRCYNTIV